MSAAGTPNEQDRIIPLAPSDPESSFVIREGVGAVLRLSWPLIVASNVISLSDVLSFFIVGRLSTESFAVIGLGLMTSAILSRSILIAFVYGYDSFASQSFGKGDFQMVGIYLYRAWFILQLIGLPTYVLLWNSSTILTLFGTQPSTAYMVSKFVTHLILYNSLMATYMLINKFLIAQRITQPQLVVSCLAVLHQPALVYLFVVVAKLDYLGLAYGYTLAMLLNVLGLVGYIVFSGACKLTLAPLGRSAFIGWGNFLQIATPSACMFLLEADSYNLVMLFAGSLDKVSIATNFALNNMVLYIYSVPVGLGNGACTLVGNALGNQKPKLAFAYAKISMALNGLVIFMFLIVFLLFRSTIASWYSDDPKVQTLFVACSPLLLFELAADMTQGILSRILTAMAKQMYASTVGLIVYFGYMVPIAYVWVYYLNWGIYGVWLACATSYWFVALAFAYKIFVEDWHQIAIDAAARIDRDKRQLQEANRMQEEKVDSAFHPQPDIQKAHGAQKSTDPLKEEWLKEMPT